MDGPLGIADMARSEERIEPAPATTAVMNRGIALAESVCPQRSPHAMAPAARHSILTEIQRVTWSSFLWLFALPDSALDLLTILTCLTLLTLPVRAIGSVA